jgi:hypothetical protein
VFPGVTADPPPRIAGAAGYFYSAILAGLILIFAGGVLVATALAERKGKQ